MSGRTVLSSRASRSILSSGVLLIVKSVSKANMLQLLIWILSPAIKVKPMLASPLESAAAESSGIDSFANWDPFQKFVSATARKLLYAHRPL